MENKKKLEHLTSIQRPRSSRVLAAWKESKFRANSSARWKTDGNLELRVLARKNNKKQIREMFLFLFIRFATHKKKRPRRPKRNNGKVNFIREKLVFRISRPKYVIIAVC